MKKSKYNITLIIVLSILCLILFFQVIAKYTNNKIGINKQESYEYTTTNAVESISNIKENKTIPNTVIEILNSNFNSEKNFIENVKGYYIKVNNLANVVTIYAKVNNDEEYTPYKAMICSTGTYTPKSGKYPIQTKWEWGALQHNVYGHYVTKITGNILFHSVPYEKYNRPDSLQYEEFDKLGTSASLGCVRLQIKDTKWIFDNIPQGTIVEFYSDENPGPLGKPKAPKISGNTECRNWDPTDTNQNNPWLLLD